MKRLLLAITLSISATAANAQSTRYYINSGDNQLGFVVQGGTVISTYSLSYVGGMPMYPLLFDGGNMVIANRSGSNAIQYDVNGAPTGTTFSNGAQNLDQLLDGGTDGTNSYAVRCCGGNGVYQGDMQFGNLRQISQLGGSGVTYAGSIGNLFALDFSGNLYQMTTSGSLLGTFNTGVGSASSLAYEQSTNTLWFAQNGTGNLYQYDLAGNQLQTFNVSGLQGYNYWAGEMQGSPATVVPEPTSVALMASGLLGLAGLARRRRARSAQVNA